MALSFTPKFANMVRVTTSTQGTGPFLCGPAVTGFASFAESVSAGDSFYYSVQGVDKPQEREVGRGTYLANGTITRQPLDGSLTHFSSGAKTIALVAAAEWYADVQSSLGQGGESAVAATRAALAAFDRNGSGACFLKEAGREGMFVWDATVPIAVHQADNRQGMFVAAAANANGAWVRRIDGPVNVRWFGAKGDNITNDGTAFVAALSYLKSTRVPFAYGKGAGALFIPAGRYFLGTTTLDLTFGTGLIGEAAGQASGSGGTVLRWSPDTTGIRTQAVNTIGATGADNAWTDYSAGRVDIRDLSLDGGFLPSSMADSEAHGIHLRVTASLHNVAIVNFAGDGVFARAVAGGGDGGEGNANVSYFERVFVQGCRNGFYLDSADVNACTFVSCNGNANRRWGFWDSSFLGNTYIGCHAAANGWDGSIGSVPTACTYSSNRYFVVPGQEAWCSTNAPSGTTASNQGWGYLSAGGDYNTVITAWTSGRTYRSGGAYFSDEANARNVFVGCYSESDQNTSLMTGGLETVVGGLHAAGLMNGLCAPYRGFSNGSNLGLTSGAFVASSDNYIAKPQSFLGGGISLPTGVLTTSHPVHSPYSDIGLQWGFTPDGSFDAKNLWWGRGGTMETFRITGPNTTEQFGSSGAKPDHIHLMKVAIGPFGGGRIISVDTAAPSGGAHAQGEIVFNQGPTLSSPVLWQAVAGGTPGTWRAIYGVGAQRTGWTAATGTPARGSFAAAAAGSASAAYSQSEAQDSRNRIAALEARLIALEADCRAHGLIN